MKVRYAMAARCAEPRGPRRAPSLTFPASFAVMRRPRDYTFSDGLPLTDTSLSDKRRWRSGPRGSSNAVSTTNSEPPPLRHRPL